MPKLIAAGGALPMDARLANLTLIADRDIYLAGGLDEEKDTLAKQYAIDEELCARRAPEGSPTC